MNKELVNSAVDKVLLSKGWGVMADYNDAVKLAEAVAHVVIGACADRLRELAELNPDTDSFTIAEEEIRALLESD